MLTQYNAAYVGGSAFVMKYFILPQSSRSDDLHNIFMQTAAATFISLNIPTLYVR